jgi:type VI protein secretion system component Hcp
MGNAKKTKAGGKKKVKDLAAKDAKAVVGGRKAGGTQTDYLVVKLDDVIVTSVTPTSGGHEGSSA